MSTIRLVRWSCLASILGLSGCVTSGSRSNLVPDLEAQPAPVVSLLPEVAPSPITLDLAGSTAADSLVTRPVDGPYRGLGGDECIALAARGSAPANLLDAKARECCASPSAGHEGHGGRQSGPGTADVRGEMLRAAALEARNKSAGAAMELYLRLGQALAQRDVLHESLAKLDEAVKERDQIKAQGLTIPAEFEELPHRRAAMTADRVALDNGIIRASAELRDLLDLGPQGESWIVWPLTSLKVDVQPIDPEAAVELGLSQRPEAILLRQLDRMQTPETLKSMQTVLGTVQPLLAMSCRAAEQSRCAMILQFLMGARTGDEDFASIRRLWNLYRIEREQEIAREIRGAALDVRAAAEQVVMASDRLRAWRSEGEQLQADQKQGVANFATRLQTDLKVLDARSTLWEKAFAWRIAAVKLQQAQFSLLP